MSMSVNEIKVGLEQITELMQALGVRRPARMAIMKVIAKEAVDATMREPLHSLPEVFRPQAG